MSNGEKSFVPKAAVENVFRFRDGFESFTSDHLVILSYIQNWTNYRLEIETSLNQIFNRINLKNNVTKNRLKDCLIELIQWEMLELTDGNSVSKIEKNSTLIFKKVNCEPPFTRVNLDIVNKILESKYEYRIKKTTLHIYYIISSYSTFEEGICFNKLDAFMEDVACGSTNTIERSIDVLEEFNLIKYENIGYRKDGENIYKDNNIYVVTCDPDHESKLTAALNKRRKIRDKESITGNRVKSAYCLVDTNNEFVRKSA